MEAKHTPTPWQRSYYADKPRYANMPEQWKVDRTIEELRIIRGPGVVGTPECNIVLRATNADPRDLNFIVLAVNCHDELLAACKAALTRMMDDPDDPQVERQVLAAIAKAEGGGK